VFLRTEDVFQPHHSTTPSARCAGVRFLCQLPCRPISAGQAILLATCFAWLLLASAVAGVSQTPAQSAGTPKYDLHAELKTKGIVDEVDLVPFGSRKDFRELVIASGQDKIHIYICPQAFEQEMGISFNKGDEIEVTGSKVKQDEADVVLVRELVKGTDTLVFRDGKGNPVWDPRTGK
jgi:hypothetical protein